MILPRRSGAPAFWAIIRFATACRVKNRPLVLTANWLSQLCSVTSTTGPMSKIAALLTRMSMPPARAATVSTICSIEAMRVTSTGTWNALPPMALAVAAASSAKRSATTTCAPSAA